MQGKALVVKTGNMKDKGIRLIKAFVNETIKRIPYILLVLIVLIFAQTVQNNHISKSNSIDTKNLLTKVAKLSEDNKQLSQQNQALTKQGTILASQSVALSKCIAYTFTTYTQTLTPVKFVDIDNCVTSAQTSSKNVKSVAPQSSTNPDASVSYPNNTPTTTTPQSNPPQPSSGVNHTPTPPSAVQRLLNNVTQIIKSLI